MRLRENHHLLQDSTAVRSENRNERRPQVVIAVMGVTGSGKSTFIRNTTGRNDIFVGHGLNSATSDVRSYKFTDDNIDYILVDTPGFNDTNYTDDVIMTRILAWLESSYRQGTKLNGLIYLHRIIDPRMQGTALQNLRMFRKLCGSNCMPNIVLATTFWGNVTPRVGDAREKELCESSEFWGEMIKKGSQVVRLQQDDRESGLKIVREIAKKNRITLEAQRELVEENKSASETAAARIINEELQKIERDMKEKIKKEREEAKLEIARQAAARDERLRQEWQEMTRIAAEKRREEKRREREEAAYWEDYRRQKREIEEAERARMQRERDQLESELQEIERLQRIQQEAENARQRYYRNYVCIGKSMSGRYCDRCSSSLHSRWVHYYHCCHCDGDNYNQCGGCGNDCGTAEHPYMTRRKTDDDCIIM